MKSPRLAPVNLQSLIVLLNVAILTSELREHYNTMTGAEQPLNGIYLTTDGNRCCFQVGAGSHAVSAPSDIIRADFAEEGRRDAGATTGRRDAGATKRPALRQVLHVQDQGLALQ